MNAMPDTSPLSADMARLLERTARELGPQPDPTLMSPAEGRAFTLESNRRWNFDLPEMATAGDAWIDADECLGSARVRLKVLVPPGHRSGGLIFAHGGGFAFCSPETHERCARVLAVETGLPVLLPDYRLSPEHPYPAGLVDVVATLRSAFVAASVFSVEEGPLIVAGDSAGANLALAALLHEQPRSNATVAGALLFYGTYSASFNTQSYRDFERGPGLTTAKMQRYWNWYAGGRDVSADPLACPLVASEGALKALPPLHLMAAGVDPLLSDSILLHERLKGLGRSDALTVVPGVTHGFLQNTIDLAAAREALAAAGKAAKDMIAGKQA
ncbi:acetyl esterase [Pseudorhizobium tarimense]|uniref:Acetyl esterase n=1 Tax=Pseudorhizobium tarimense TaxID=1079109 RepID=A0ABV2H5A5_9HYPH|nr:alpha/beta hydrolase fold domain-containing protein [Pseudorhizobium tarimense]MCJ8518821.1 alpha/beta hydrolase [Pseudorhizobium tarimense]